MRILNQAAKTMSYYCQGKINSLKAFIKHHSLPVCLFILLLIKLVVNLDFTPGSPSRFSVSDREARLSKQYLQQKRSLVDLLCTYQVPFNLQDKWQLAEIILEESRRNQLDPRLILAVIFTESRFYSSARSKKDARGLMQLLHPTAQAVAQEIGLQSYDRRTLLHDPYFNLRLGIYDLAQLIRRFNNLELALAAYNIGPSRLDQILASKESVPTGFSRKVMRHYRQAQTKNSAYFLN